MRNRQKIIGFIGAFLLSFVASGAAQAATYYVATNGSDSNPGTQASPWKTFQKAINTVQGGDTAYFSTGTYAKGNFTNLTAPAGQWITFKPYQNAKVVINTAGGSISLRGATRVILDGFEITDLGYNQKLNSIAQKYGVSPSCDIVTSATCRNLAADLLGSGSPGLALSSGCHDVIITNSEIHHIADHGILGSCNNFQLLNNHIHHNGYAGLIQGYGIYLSNSSNALIRGNRFHDNSGVNIRIGNLAAKPIIDSIVENNRVYNARDPFFHSGNGGQVKQDGLNIALYGSAGSIIRNNIIYSSYGTGMWAVNINPSKPDLIYNNVFYGNGSYGLLLSGNSVARNNIIWGNATKISAYELRMTNSHTGRAEYNIVGGNRLLIQNQGTGTESNNIKNSDPKFVNAGSGDFGIQAGSPAIDKGMTLAQVPDDFTGKKRPEGAAYDIGAFEGAGSKANVLPGVGAGLPVGVGGIGGGGGIIPGIGNCFH